MRNNEWKSQVHKELTEKGMSNKKGKFARKIVREAIKRKMWLERETKNK